MTSGDVILSLGSALVGAILSWLFTILHTKYKFRQELESNNSVDVSGDDWHAAWQTSVDEEEILNTERLVLLQKGATVQMWNKEKSPENPKGGYLWTAQLQFLHGRDVMGWYLPKTSENITSKGMLFLNYDSARRVFVGKWVGVAYDGALCNGFVVISKERASSLEMLRRVVERHPARVRVISQIL